MAELVWDADGDRIYEAGLDRGVLYPAVGPGVVWNGLISVDEDLSEETTTSVYVDGIKYYDEQTYSDFKGTLTAYTYPEEFLEYDGVIEVEPGMYVEDQHPQVFHLAYRTLVADDIEGTNLGYRIHILYNLLATQNDSTYTTESNAVDPVEFVWDLRATPPDNGQFRPTAHIILDSRMLNPSFLNDIEGILYGSEDEDARLPEQDEMIEIANEWGSFITIIDHGDGRWSAIGAPEYITMLDETTFQISGADTTEIDPDTYTISTT